MSFPWIVECKSCRRVITCFSVDPQAEHMLPRRTSRPETLPCHLPVLLENVALLGRADREGDAKTEPGASAQATDGRNPTGPC